MPAEPSVRRLIDPAEVTPAMRTALTACWRDVADAGAAVGFAGQVPVTEDDVAPVLDRTVTVQG